ncbi:MAG: DNA recombination protein RmuC [Synergistaceae bacterium]|jgi:DNA recombination protein RmuC|nr:DNA recombination protein RmuC [Synergistaceae bacterium]
MGTQLIFNIVIAALLGVTITLLIKALMRESKIDVSEIADLLKHNSSEQRDSVAKQISSGATEQFARFGLIQESVQTTLQGNREEVNKQLREFQAQIDARLSAIQKSSTESNDRINASVTKTLQESRAETNEQLGKFSTQLDTRLSAIQEQTQKTLQSSRGEANKQLREFQEQLDTRLSSIQRGNAENIEKVNATLENKMKSLQESNEKRLEQIQGVVDEKLQKTLETRLTQSFELVSKQLNSVQQGLGEMKNLAADAKSLKNALINVKERGTYGEVRLEKLLSDILAPSQYEMNSEIANNKRVEFVIKLPGNGDTPLLLPIDSKFPIEDYNRLLDAEDKTAIDDARRSLAQKIRSFAKDIYDKYIVPPKTTDFALMFLPTEGLYAEVIQNAALFEELRDKYKVTAVGATTLSAFLASLQMGFKTLVIEQRSQDVWNTLRSVKSEFGKFGDMLDKAHKQIQTADKTLDEIVGKRTRAIKRTLRGVEELAEAGSAPLFESMKLDDDDAE